MPTPQSPSDGSGNGHWLGRVLSPYTAPARLEHAGPVDPTTFALLACAATVRAALLTPGGALLDLGRTQRLATPAQKTALLARDGGCVIPGCTVPGPRFFLMPQRCVRWCFFGRCFFGWFSCGRWCVRW